MKRETIFRLSFRLTSRDIDLLWVDADNQLPALSVLVKKTLRNMLQGVEEAIPLPNVPNKSLMVKTVGIRFYKNEDEEIVAWLESIEKGSRGFVIKELLRHAMTAVDYRPYMKGERTLTAIAIQKRSYHQWNMSARPAWEPDESALNTPDISRDNIETDNEAADDDWLSAFAKMSNQ